MSALNQQPIGVLFVCLGNICRSPMAEAVFRTMVERRGLTEQYRIDSAGTSGWHNGERPHRGTIECLIGHEVSASGMFSRQVRADDFERFQYIVCMDESNVQHVIPFAKGPHQAVVKRLLEWVPGRSGQDADVPDPYYDDRFERVYELVSQGCERLLDEIEAGRIPAGNG